MLSKHELGSWTMGLFQINLSKVAEEEKHLVLKQKVKGPFGPDMQLEPFHPSSPFGAHAVWASDPCNGDWILDSVLDFGMDSVSASRQCVSLLIEGNINIFNCQGFFLGVKFIICQNIIKLLAIQLFMVSQKRSSI